MSKKRKIIFWIAIIILALCVGYLVYYFVGKQERSKVYNDIKEQAVTKDEPSTKEEPVKEDTTAEIPIDFATLQAQYPDLYAWIEIPGIEELSYPIMQSLTDDTYYLDYTIDGVYGYPGSIYTESTNAKDFTDFNTIVYGHDMLDGTMFGSLKNYRDQDFFNNHRTITVYTPEHILTYQVFAAVTFDDRHILNTYDFSDPGARQDYITAISSLAGGENIVADDVAVNTDSKILTLSTCISDQPTSRFLIQAVLINEQ